MKPLSKELLNILTEFLKKVPDELIERKKSLRLSTFTDLLTLMQKRLENPNFVDSVRSRYKAVLIDEFQDTDPVQYSIFKTLFLPKKKSDTVGYPSTVVFVGDPKQSIYLFRDADIKTYEKAREDLGDTRSLNNNYRSSPLLLAAFNSFFSMQKEKQRIQYFKYQDVIGAQPKLPLMRKNSSGTFSIVPVLSIWTDEADVEKIEEVRTYEAQNIVKDICSLLDGTVYKNVEKKKRLNASDIAILVRKYKDADALLPLLRKHGISYQLDCDEDVFLTEEAREILDILKAIETPDDIKRVNWARATRIFHESVNTIAYGRVEPLPDTITTNESESNRARSKARTVLLKASETFSRYGISAAFSELFNEYKTEEKVLSEPDGETRLSNYRHILELLQDANAERKSLSALLRWFAKQMSQAKSQTPDKRKVRLTSDGDRVSVMSIHKSKGLEFPVVYVAGAFNKPEGSQKSIAFRQTGDSGTTLWLSHEPITNQAADAVMEALKLKPTFVSDEVQENERIAYVAMTRASQRLVLPLMLGGKHDRNSRANNAYYRLMRGGECEKADDVQALFDEFKAGINNRLTSKQPEASKLTEVIKNIQTLTKTELSVSDFVEKIKIEKIEELPCLQKQTVDSKSFEADVVYPVRHSWLKSSFTAITKNAHALELDSITMGDNDKDADEEPDELEPVETGKQEVNAYFTVQNAATFGDLVHKLFEKAEFEKAPSASDGNDEDISTFHRLVFEGLKYFEEWKDLQETLVNLILSTLTRPITFPNNRAFKLSDIKKSERTAEMEFTMSVKGQVSAKDLKTLLDHFDAKYHLPELQDLDLQGFLTGFIDLAFTHDGEFWVLDWKTNKRGLKSAHDVTDVWVASQMKEHAYTLQYLIYLVALKRYLESIGIEKTPSGAIYVFVASGVEHKAQDNTGLWVDPVPPSLINCLDDFFANGYNEAKVREAAILAAKGM